MAMPGMAVTEGNSVALASEVVSGAGEVVATGAVPGTCARPEAAAPPEPTGFFLTTVVTGYLVFGVVTMISTGGSSIASSSCDLASSNGRKANSKP
jgi:hypothetical protein